jgi:thiol-disulfide isomerase/thioredoxin
MGMLGARSFSVAFLVVCHCLALAYARPTVRNVKTYSEFKKLLKHHAEVTGLPVIIDYYSDGCGPCRMVAPHYKKMAEQYKDKAVFAKVDINFNRETASREQISSMPTFQVKKIIKVVDCFSPYYMKFCERSFACLCTLFVASIKIL